VSVLDLDSTSNWMLGRQMTLKGFARRPCVRCAHDDGKCYSASNSLGPVNCGPGACGSDTPFHTYEENSNRYVATTESEYERC
jgi:hypothetical protein